MFRWDEAPYTSSKFNILGIIVIVGRFRYIIYVMKSIMYVVILYYLGYSLVN